MKKSQEATQKMLITEKEDNYKYFTCGIATCKLFHADQIISYSHVLKNTSRS